MNFWEARRAALEGKKVKMIGTTRSAPYEPDMFLSIGYWTKSELDAEWEIVEEPKPIIRFINVYSGVAWGTHSSKKAADLSADDGFRLSCLEIITDENGKLISARNV